MDIVFIKQLQIDTTIGAYEWEKSIKQTLLLDLEMAWDNRPAAENDELDKALDYARVSERISQWLANQQIELIETVAERIAQMLQDEFGISWLRLTVNKPGAVANAACVGVVIERGQRH